jgi:SAM-dependent methyltransferase
MAGDQSDANRYVDGTYAASTGTWHEEDAVFKARWIADFLRRNQVSASSVCDVGCGSGGVLAALRNEWPDVALVGYEVSPQAADLAARLHPGIDVRVGDPSRLGDHYELALALDVFEHVEDYIGFLRRLSTLADRFVFHIPLDMTALMVARETPILTVRAAVGHLHYFSKATALATLSDAGFRMCATAYTPGTLELPGRTWRMRLLAGPRRIAFRFAPNLAVRLLGGYSLLVLATPR